jgi:hypothetical protein
MSMREVVSQFAQDGKIATGLGIGAAAVAAAAFGGSSSRSRPQHAPQEQVSLKHCIGLI